MLHFVFGQSSMGYLTRVAEDKGVEGDEKKDNTASMVAWLRVNVIRGVVADFPAWVCYFVAFVWSTG
jgi:hypothetical protein